MSVVGPGRRGVVVATAVPTQARRDREWLEDAGIPAATPDDLGLHLKAFVLARGEERDEPAGPVAGWSRALRRPAVASLGDRGVYAATPTSRKSLAREEAIDVLREGIDQPFPRRIAVFGGAWIDEEEPEHEEARRLGRGLAEADVDVVTGGYQGIMAAVSRGASEGERSPVVGVTIAPWSERVAVNEWLTHELEARDLMARLPVICDADAWVAFPGGVGTLSEVALCWNLVQTESVEPRPLVIVGERWDRALRRFRELLIAEDVHFDLVRPAASAEEALRLLSR
ncbi:MAG: LOG family protein [Actinomycetota bacterium]